MPALGPEDDWPAVTCLCPTYGRFGCLRLALACFLAQDYPGRKQLLILNDADTAIGCGPLRQGIHLWQTKGRFANLGEKRQALLETAMTPLAAHWDDDDLYLPHHLTRSVEALLGRLDADLKERHARPYGCVKSAGAYFMVGGNANRPGKLRGVRHNVFEGTMVFRREEALALGGYPPLHSGQAKALMGKFHRAGRLYKIADDEGGGPSYVYRWGQGVGHVSAYYNKPDTLRRFRAENADMGDGRPLTPGDLRSFLGAVRDYQHAPVHP